jgi:ribosomal protein S12 methylthiotransferase accessory factor
MPALQRYPRLWVVIADGTNATALGASWTPDSGNGIGRTRSEAAAAAIGEFVERYCAGFPPPALIEGTWETMATRMEVPSPEEFNNLHAPNDPAFSAIDHEMAGRWCSGVWGHDRDRITAAPWSLVSLAATAAARGFADHWYPGPAISTGLACGGSWDDAARRAILEICERDAIMLAWYTRDFRARLSQQLILKTWPDLAYELARCRLESLLLDVTNDLDIPTFMSVVRPIGNNHRGAFGMASALTQEQAAERALMESMQSWTWADGMRSTGESIVTPGVRGEFPDFSSRVAAYGAGIMWSELAEFDAQAQAAVQIEIFSGSTELDYLNVADLAQVLKERTHAVQLFDLTTDDIREVGLYVVRALCPTLQPMDSAHHGRRVVATRLATRRFSKLYCDTPHPFP